MKGKIKKDYQFECVKGIIFCITILTIMCLMMTCYKVVAEAAVYYVPDRYKSIKAAIDAAAHGDTIIVRSGTYTGADNRNLEFAGKSITVKSENGDESTIIDCQDAGRGFIFSSGETNSSVIDGFTIKNGFR